MSKETIAQKLRIISNECNDEDEAVCEMCKALNGNCVTDSCLKWLNSLADEIEREQRENFIQIPINKDGEPVLIGRTYYGGDGTAWKVRGFRGGGWPVVATNPYGETKELKGKWLSQNDPTIWRDADGEPLEVGATYWVVDESDCSMINRKTGMPVLVTHMCGKRCTCEYEGEGGIFCGFTDAKNLTHREPDSLVKLRDDMHDYLDACGEEWREMRQYADRLTAIMERDA